MYIFRKIICFTVGHYWINLNTQNHTADCSRCGDSYNVSYDMCYSGTYATSKRV